MKKSMCNKKRILLVCAVAVVILAGVLIYASAQNAPYRWSRDVCEAIRLGDTGKALELIEEGAGKGYSMDTLSERPSVLWALLESTPHTPLQAACTHGNYEAAEALFRHGASASPAEGGSSREPIFCVLLRAYQPDDAVLIRLLIDHGAAFCDEQLGETVMVQAAFRSPNRSDPAADGSNEARVYDAEAAKGITDVFLILSEYGNCYATNEAGQNALHCAVMMGNWYLADVLTDRLDFPLDARDIHGKTAYDLAVESGADAEILAQLKIG